MRSPKDVLYDYWGFSSFRPVQEDIVEAVVEGKDVLALMPTGGGKSICFQVPALVKEGICIVVSPLIALMKDQVEGLQAKGIRAAMIFSGMNSREIDITLDRKSTRLNSSHVKISYAVFCLKKKKRHTLYMRTSL